MDEECELNLYSPLNIFFMWPFVAYSNNNVLHLVGRYFVALTLQREVCMFCPRKRTLRRYHHQRIILFVFILRASALVKADKFCSLNFYNQGENDAINFPFEDLNPSTSYHSKNETQSDGVELMEGEG